ncbi:MAG: hypothetical protein RUDDFDWM_001370 [Candidatus Fervidibacterota bacterium]
MDKSVARRVAEKLMAKRREFGLSQAQVAEKIGCTREYISMIESGKRMPNLMILKRLAELYKVDIQWLLGEESSTNVFSMLLRAAPIGKADKKRLEEFVKCCEDYAWLERILAVRKKEAPQYRYTTPSFKPEMSIWAKKLASEERKRLGLGDDPIGDIFKLLENQGLHIIRIPLPNSRIDGAFAYDPEKGAFALINADRKKGKQVFTAAHEYCHFIKDRSSGYHPCETAEGYSPPHQKDLERFADLFATHFLMPEEGVRSIVESNFNPAQIGVEDVIYLKRHFGVSYMAMLIRLKELGYIRQTQFEQLREVSVEKIERTLYGESEERQEQPPKIPPLLAVLALEAYSRRLISLDRLAEIWRISSSEAYEILKSAGYEVD